jgi:hypothetical protein
VADRIPGAPAWVNEFLQRVDERFDVVSAHIEAVIVEVRGYRDRISDVEARQNSLADEQANQREAIAEIRRTLRSLTPPGGYHIGGNGSAPPDGNAE